MMMNIISYQATYQKRAYNQNAHIFLSIEQIN